MRIIAATHRDLEREVKEGRFREDLYYRLTVFPIDLPPLRQRRDDIPDLARHFLQRQQEREARAPTGFTGPALDALCAYDWFGNIRELENEVERAVLLGSGEERIAIAHLSEKIHLGTATQVPRKGKLKNVLARVERELIAQALKRHNGNRTPAAADLEMSRWGLVQKIKTYQISG